MAKFDLQKNVAKAKIIKKKKDSEQIEVRHRSQSNKTKKIETNLQSEIAAAKKRVSKKSTNNNSSIANNNAQKLAKERSEFGKTVSESAPTIGLLFEQGVRGTYTGLTKLSKYNNEKHPDAIRASLQRGSAHITPELLNRIRSDNIRKANKYLAKDEEREQQIAKDIKNGVISQGRADLIRGAGGLAADLPLMALSGGVGATAKGASTATKIGGSLIRAAASPYTAIKLPSNYGSRIDEAIKEGATDKKANVSALMYAPANTLMERLGGGEAAVAKAMGKRLSGSIFGNIAKSAGSEALEEAAQTSLGSITKLPYKKIPVFSMNKNTEAMVNPMQMGYNAALGGTLGALGGGIGVAVNKAVPQRPTNTGTIMANKPNGMGDFRNVAKKTKKLDSRNDMNGKPNLIASKNEEAMRNRKANISNIVQNDTLNNEIDNNLSNIANNSKAIADKAKSGIKPTAAEIKSLSPSDVHAAARTEFKTETGVTLPNSEKGTKKAINAYAERKANTLQAKPLPNLLKNVNIKNIKTKNDNVVQNGLLIPQSVIDNYVERAYKYNSRSVLPKQASYLNIAKPSQRLINDLLGEFDVSNYTHVLRDNDIRHIRNSHGEQTNEKYPVTIGDIKQIPNIIKNYDDVYYVPQKGKDGIYYIKRHNGVTYYLEQAMTTENGEKHLSNKQMIKVPTGSVPNIKGLKDAMENKKSTVIDAHDNSDGTMVPPEYTPYTSNNNASIGNISQSSGKVNQPVGENNENLFNEKRVDNVSQENNYQDAIDKYGVQNEPPAEPVPNKTESDNKVSKFVQTAMDSNVLDEEGKVFLPFLDCWVAFFINLGDSALLWDFCRGILF